MITLFCLELKKTTTNEWYYFLGLEERQGLDSPLFPLQLFPFQLVSCSHHVGLTNSRGLIVGHNTCVKHDSRGKKSYFVSVLPPSGSGIHFFRNKK